MKILIFIIIVLSLSKFTIIIIFQCCWLFAFHEILFSASPSSCTSCSLKIKDINYEIDAFNTISTFILSNATKLADQICQNLPNDVSLSTNCLRMQSDFGNFNLINIQRLDESSYCSGSSVYLACIEVDKIYAILPNLTASANTALSTLKHMRSSLNIFFEELYRSYLLDYYKLMDKYGREIILTKFYINTGICELTDDGLKLRFMKTCFDSFLLLYCTRRNNAWRALHYFEDEESIKMK
jgi:hypothetical protein